MEKDALFYYNEGASFYKMANNCLARPDRKFNNELLFNVLSMSIERLLISALLNNGIMPISETASGLMRETSKLINWPESCIQQARWLNRFVHLCSLEPIPLKIPDDSEIQQIMLFAGEVKKRVDPIFEPQLV
jgi:hypothetical protein